MVGRRGDLQADDPVLSEILHRLVKAFQPERIYLFGSKARSDAGPDSDYDLMIVVPDDAPLSAGVVVGHIRPCAALVRLPTSWSGRGRPLTAACISHPLYPRPLSGKGNYYMPADPILVADTQGWLRKAATDLRAAKHDLGP